jgi:hypothetical protein
LLTLIGVHIHSPAECFADTCCTAPSTLVAVAFHCRFDSTTQDNMELLVSELPDGGYQNWLIHEICTPADGFFADTCHGALSLPT